jgi:hypothetical protein
MKIKYNNADVENLQLSNLGVVSLLSKQKESEKEVNKKRKNKLQWVTIALQQKNILPPTVIVLLRGQDNKSQPFPTWQKATDPNR